MRIVKNGRITRVRAPTKSQTKPPRGTTIELARRIVHEVNKSLPNGHYLKGFRSAQDIRESALHEARVTSQPLGKVITTKDVLQKEWTERNGIKWLRDQKRRPL